MSTEPFRIATRKSPLALWQAEHVRARLLDSHPGLEVELVTMSTKGDRVLDSPLAKIGGKGLFVKELEQRMLDGDADIAVHSMKDVPVTLPDGLHLAVILEREDPRDAFVSNHYADLQALPGGARVGTSSLRRQCQLADRRPDLEIAPLRGNVNTRLRKLDDGEFDAIILASAGLLRLNFGERIRNFIPTDDSLPAIGQGAEPGAAVHDREALVVLADAERADDHAAVVDEVSDPGDQRPGFPGACGGDDARRTRVVRDGGELIGCEVVGGIVSWLVVR